MDTPFCRLNGVDRHSTKTVVELKKNGKYGKVTYV